MKKNILIILSLFLFSGLTGSVAGQEVKADDIVGTYTVGSPFNDDVARVKVTKTAKGTYQGQVVWANKTTNEDGTVRTDSKNPDKKLRSRRYDEVIMFWDITFDGKEWVGGKLYDPYTGKTFNVKFKPIKNSRNIKARYYKGIPAIGIDGEWVWYN